MGNREKNLARRIIFTAEDFEPLFESEGIDFLTLTDSEWRSFETMFGDGTAWSQVVKDAAWTIKLDREKNV